MGSGPRPPTPGKGYIVVTWGIILGNVYLPELHQHGRLQSCYNSPLSSIQMSTQFRRSLAHPAVVLPWRSTLASGMLDNNDGLQTRVATHAMAQTLIPIVRNGSGSPHCVISSLLPCL